MLHKTSIIQCNESESRIALDVLVMKIQHIYTKKRPHAEGVSLSGCRESEAVVFSEAYRSLSAGGNRASSPANRGLRGLSNPLFPQESSKRFSKY